MRAATGTRAVIRPIHFNPLPPRGEGHVTVALVNKQTGIPIHSPRGGETWYIFWFNAKSCVF